LPVAASPAELESILEKAVAGSPVSPQEAYALCGAPTNFLPRLMEAARAVRARTFGRQVTFSKKVLIPVTRLCRNACAYCNFSRKPSEVRAPFLPVEEAVAIADWGRACGCKEALIIAGERPEDRYPDAAEWLSEHGYGSTVEYVHELCRRVTVATGLLPHCNLGVLDEKELVLLKDVSVSVGLMLESTAERLCCPGGPHALSPGKVPRLRLRTVAAAGRLRIPFTTGILVGIGETEGERVHALLAIARMHSEYGHIQEVIVQGYRSSGAHAAGCRELEVFELLKVVCLARLILPADVSVQVPPNLSPDSYGVFLLAGINDWGGISPVTRDEVNPAYPWPQVDELRRMTSSYGLILRERLAVYPAYLHREGFVSDRMKEWVARVADRDGLAREGG
jgi:7,8-didemethyl-8-hydroxy-5-deazariboflavin synthase CofG subunit